MKKIIENLAVTAELMGATISPNALAVMAKDLGEYDEILVLRSLQSFRKECSRFSLDGIIKHIEKNLPNKRLLSDEAWAIYPKDETSSAVITDEIAEAMQSAQPLLDDGDKIGARMAFKQAYERVTERNKLEGRKPKWFASLGTEKTGREIAVKEAVRLGRLSKEYEFLLLPPSENFDISNSITKLQKLMQIENKSLTDDERKSHHEKMMQIKKKLTGEI